MSFGLTVRNDDNYVQIDSDNPRLCALYSGAYAATSSTVATVTFPSPIRTPEPPCIFIRNSPNQPQVLYRSMTVVGAAGNWTGFRLEAGDNVDSRPAGKWFAAVFASRSAASWGLRMWDDSGVIIYDSGAVPVLFTKATNSWSFQGWGTWTDIGSAYYWRSAVTGPIASDEYFMINPFSRGILSPNNPNWLPTGARFSYTENRLQLFGNGSGPGGITAWSDLGAPAVVFARLPGT